MKLLLLIIVFIANIPSMAQAETAIVPLARAQKFKPAAIAAPVAKLATPVRAAATTTTASPFGLLNTTPAAATPTNTIRYGYTAMPGSPILPQAPAAAAQPSNGSNPMSTFAPLLGGLGGLGNSFGGSPGSSNNARTHTAASPAEIDDSQTAVTPTPAAQTTQVAAQPATALPPAATPAATADPNAPANPQVSADPAAPPPGAVATPPPGTPDTPAAPAAPAAPGTQVTAGPTAPPAAAPPAPQPAHVAGPAEAHPVPPETVPPQVHFPQCPRTTDDPKKVNQMLETAFGLKHARSHSFVDSTNCATSYGLNKAGQLSLVMTGSGCSYAGTIPAKMCQAGNSLRAIANTSQSDNFKVRMYDAYYHQPLIVTLTPEGNGRYVSSNSATTTQTQLVEVSTAGQ